MVELGKVDFLHAHRKYTKSMLARARDQAILKGRFRVKVVIPEDLIGLKVQSSSNDPQRYHQDMADIEAIIKVNLRTLNMDLIKEYFALFDKQDELSQLLQRLNYA